MVKIVECSYCQYEYKLNDSWMKDGFGLIHECANCEEEYLIMKTEVKKLASANRNRVLNSR